MIPTIALCNIFGQDEAAVLAFARRHGFKGIDWSLDPEARESDFLFRMERLKGLEIRYHARYFAVNIAYSDDRADRSMRLFQRTVDLVAKAGGKYLTIHIGLGEKSSRGLDWERGLRNLADLVSYGHARGVTMCLENLFTGWTSQPALFHVLVRSTGAGVTFDIGHAQVRQQKGGNELVEKYVISNRNFIYNAHIYHTEIPGSGHIAPKELADICHRLDLLRLAELCDWWVIELEKPDDILRTMGILRVYFDHLLTTGSDLESAFELPREGGRPVKRRDLRIEDLG